MDNFPEYTQTHPALQNHPLFNGSQSVAMISGESPKWINKLPLSQQEHVSKYGHKALGQDLKKLGLRHEETEGSYGSPERSYIVYGAGRDQMNNLANKYGQDSFIHVAAGHKTAKMHFSDLAEDEQGHSLKNHYVPSKGTYAFHPTEKPDDYYTHLPGKGYMRLNLDFDKPPISSEPSKDITKSELKEKLLVVLKKALRAYEVDGIPVERKTELSKLANGKLKGLASEAKKAPNYDDFRKDYTGDIKHGMYWHVTGNPNFTIDPNKGPTDASTAGTGTTSPGDLMVTSDLNHWLSFYPKRTHAALIDLSGVPREHYRQIGRGFGNEFYINNANRAKVIKVVPRHQARRIDKDYDNVKPRSEDELKFFHGLVHSSSLK
jgi:hypothetical protein